MENETLELTPRELYRLKKLLNGPSASGEGKPSSSEDVVFDAEELALVVKEAVTDALDEYFETHSEPKSGNAGSKSKSDKPEEKRSRRLI